MSTFRRAGAGIVALGAVLALGTGLSAGTASAEGNFVTSVCHSENPFPWQPAFNYVLDVRAGYGSNAPWPQQSLIFVNGVSDNRNIEVALNLAPYAVSTRFDWHNINTDQRGSTTFDQTQPIPTVRATVAPGPGRIEFTSTQTTGALFSFLNPQISVCKGVLDVPAPPRRTR
ncbi:hypothetical protein [Antrihabitans cavernicola]|uniref:Uncharacterized protein n=1 Tax=Antrihabitans cavernicola TaxID=2495913 RepID=A0A5A7S9F5_9NOCA|nr:hypothetical protein [Spelaeibacter cavernicola]KAA0021879.1 hypothetical protein FOY51_15910 [Spelaeibacter cavernicola]